MDKDIKFKKDNYNFKFRVGGIIIVDDKVLGVEIKDCNFFCLPGGHVQFGETTLEAIKREMKEELNIHIVDAKHFLSAENIYTNNYGEFIHELGAYYIVKVDNIKNLNLNEYTIIENNNEENKKLHFKWFLIDELKKVDFRPDCIKTKLLTKKYNFEYIRKNETNI